MPRVWYSGSRPQSQQSDPERCYYIIPVVDQSGGMLNDPVLQMLDQDHYWLSIADSDLLLYIKGLAIAGDLTSMFKNLMSTRLPSKG